MYEFFVMQTGSPIDAYGIEDMSIVGWEFLSTLYWVEQRAYLTYFRRERIVQ